MLSFFFWPSKKHGTDHAISPCFYIFKEVIHMKRLSWLLLLSLIFTLPLFFTAPSPALATSAPIITLDDCAADHLAPLAANYIGNSNTGKFHYPSCYWVSRMSENHKVYFDSREEAINSGYVPCKVCKP